MKKDTITIVMVSETREPLTFEFSIKEIVLIVILLLALVSTAVFSIVNFKDLKTQHQELSASLKLLKEDLAVREDQISELKLKLNEQKEMIMLVGENQDTSAITPGNYSKDIIIENLEIDHSERTLNLKFQLVNNTEDQRLFSGFLLIVAEHKGGDLSKFGTYPEFRMSAGRALNYHQGDPYAIRKFKNLEVEINLVDSVSSYNKIKFLVFNGDGKPLLYDDRELSL